MKKSCSYCGRIHPKGYVCQLKPKKDIGQNRKKNRSEADRFRSTMQWRRLSERIRERDKHICQACLHGLGSPIRWRPSDPVEVHHIDPMESAFEKKDDEDNLITLCKIHHEEAEAGRIDTGTLKTIAKKNNKEDIIIF
ncbi:HNH endonuclease [Emergencia sp.]|uniref:HNH endonuclease n=1 Tax=Emergencia sp. TaxID=1926557 RepID=UPI003AF1B175